MGHLVRLRPQQLLPQTKGDWKAMELPAWESGGARSGAMGGSSFVLPKDGANSELAWLFYKFLMFDEADTRRCGDRTRRTPMV